MIRKIFRFRQKPKPQVLESEFMRLNWEMFSSEKGQEYLYHLKHKIGYDLNTYKSKDGDRVWADMHEGMKDCVRLIEASLHKYNKQITEKENNAK